MKANAWVIWAVVMLALLGVATAAQATPLPAGFSGVSVTNLGSFTGTLVTDTLTQPYAFTGGTGTVREWVVRDATGALCAACLSFVYQVHVNTGVVGLIAGAPYNGFSVDVTHFVGPSALLPGSVEGEFGANSADRSADGNTVGFNFTPSPITPGLDSFLEIANTNSTTFIAGTIHVDGAGTNGTPLIAGFAPGVAAVPEPATVVLIGSGLVALGIWRRRR
jgi:hypothetical protein